MVSGGCWLPKAGNCGNFVQRSTFPIPPDTVETPPPPPERRPSRHTAVPLAFEFQRLLARGDARNRADLARRFGLSRARVTQIMNILELPGPIVDYLSSLPHEEKCRFSERELRRIVALPTEEEQVKAFEELRRAVETWNLSGCREWPSWCEHTSEAAMCLATIDGSSEQT